MHREDNAKATQIPVAAIPAGSGNAIARTLSYFSGASLSMTSSIYDAVLVACQGHTFRMDGFRVTQKSLPELVQRFRSRRSDSAANSKLGNGNGNGELEKKSENGNGNGKEVNENEKSLFGVVSLQWGLGESFLLYALCLPLSFVAFLAFLICSVSGVAHFYYS